MFKKPVINCITVVLSIFIFVKCSGNYGEESEIKEDNVLDTNKQSEEEPLPPIIEYDLYEEKEFSIKRSIPDDNTILKVNFVGNIDFNFKREMSLEVVAISDIDSVFSELNLSNLMVVEYSEVTNFDSYFKYECRGLAGEVKIKNSGVYDFNFKLLLGDSIIRVNKAKIIVDN